MGAGKYYNQNQGGRSTRRFDRQAHTTFYQQENSGRIKCKRPTSKHIRSPCTTAQLQLRLVPRLSGSFGTEAPSTTHILASGWPGQWVYPVTNRLLLQAGGRICTNMTIQTSSPRWRRYRHPGLANGVWYQRAARRAPASGPGKEHDYSQQNQRFSLSISRDRHNLKFGINTQQGIESWGPSRSITVPAPLIHPAMAYRSHEWRRRSLGGVAVRPLREDQWVVKRATLNLACASTISMLRAGADPRAGPFVGSSVSTGSLTRATSGCQPPAGAAYDLFGNGKTALKASVGRYVQSLGAIREPDQPGERDRAEHEPDLDTDLNGNYAPDCDLINRAGNGSAEPSTMRRSGRSGRTGGLRRRAIGI